MELSLEESRVFRHLPQNDMNTVYLYCKHREYREVATPEGSVLRCIRCCRWWFPREPYPPPYGNPSLERFMRPCEHTRIRTLEGTTTMNKCIECDDVFPKNTAAVVWKNMRERTGDFIGMVGGLFQGRRLMGDGGGGRSDGGSRGGKNDGGGSIKPTKGGGIKFSPPSSGAMSRPLTSMPSPRQSPGTARTPPPPSPSNERGRMSGGGGGNGIGMGGHPRSRVNSTPTPTSGNTHANTPTPISEKTMTNSMSPQMLPEPAIALPRGETMESIVNKATLHPEEVSSRHVVITEEDDEVF